MFVSNLTSSKLGIGGRVILGPKEINRFVPDTDVDLAKRVAKLEAAKLIAVVREEGLTKTGIPGKVVKTVGVDLKAVDTKPRTVNDELQAEAPAAEEVKEEEKVVKRATRRVKKVVTEEPAETAAEVTPANE